MALAVKIELFKRGCFDFITVKDGKKHEKQEKALLRPVPKQSYITLSYCGEVSRGEMDKRTEKRAGFSVLCIDQVSCVF